MNKKEKYLTWLRNTISILVISMFVLALVSLIFGYAKNKQRVLFSLFQFLMMIIVLYLPKIAKNRFNIEIPFFMDICFVLFSFCGFILGDVFNFYGKFPIWDSILHAFSGVILAYVGLVIIKNLNKENIVPISISPMFISISVVMFSLALGAVWEIGEYIADDIFNTNAQQYMKTTEGTLIGKEDVALVGHEALADTMKDLMLDLGGAVVIASIAYHNMEKKQKKDS